jgi:DsbC/DsbD-like thiol-disulfide interchange protein
MIRLILAASILVFGGERTALADPSASAWVPAYQSRARLLAGQATAEGERPRVIAGVEIEMPVGWKTYWRNPGDAGGLPPSFDWSASQNVAAVDVLYPAPLRLIDSSGETIGYQDGVIFPVRIESADPARPVRLDVVVAYGVCKDICVPAESRLTLDIDPSGLTALPQHLASAIDRVPRQGTDRRASDPEIVSAAWDETAGRAGLAVTVRYPGGSAGADLFLEGPPGLYVPLAQRGAEIGADQVRFAIPTDGVDLAALQTATLTATMVGPLGAASVEFKLPPR